MNPVTVETKANLVDYIPVVSEYEISEVRELSEKVEGTAFNQRFTIAKVLEVFSSKLLKKWNNHMFFAP